MANQYDKNGSEYGQTAFPGGTKKLTPASKDPGDQYAGSSGKRRSQYDRNGGQKPDQNKKVLIVCIAVLFALLLAAIVWIVFSATHRGKAEDNPIAAAETPKTTKAPTPEPTEAPTPKPTEAPTPTLRPTEAPTAKSTETSTPGLRLPDGTKAGDIILFGSYEQDNNPYNGTEDIEWLVLAKEKDRVLVISRYALDCRPYNAKEQEVTWETCFLHGWLNDTFLNNAFSADEQAMIRTETVTADRNPSYGTSPGRDTTDKVFLLSIAEVNQYLTGESARKCQATAYAVKRGAYINPLDGNCWWWLRSPGMNSFLAAIVNYVGSVGYDGVRVHTWDGAVRPALWINIGS
jgi:hypothetical protein